jgi:hypothetical protein
MALMSLFFREKGIRSSEGEVEDAARPQFNPTPKTRLHE